MIGFHPQRSKRVSLSDRIRRCTFGFCSAAFQVRPVKVKAGMWRTAHSNSKCLFRDGRYKPWSSIQVQLGDDMRWSDFLTAALKYSDTVVMARSFPTIPMMQELKGLVVHTLETNGALAMGLKKPWRNAIHHNSSPYSNVFLDVLNCIDQSGSQTLPLQTGDSWCA